MTDGSAPGGAVAEDVDADLVAALFGDRSAMAHDYARLLSTSGLERGLIGPREVPRLWERHLLNCAVVGELVPAAATVADVGSGAGLPGLVLAIVRPDLEVYLIEPLLRRVTWLREVVAELGLSNVELVRGRAEQVAESGARYDVVTARAVAALPALVGFCLPLVRPQGLLLAMKGESAESELRESQGVLDRAGVVEARVVRCGADRLASRTTVVEVRLGDRPVPVTKPGDAARSKKKRRR